jgi:glycosyltransferase involved in cell wall biosynthesis
MATESRKTIFVVVSTLMTVKAFLLNHIATLSQHYDVVVIANDHNTEALKLLGVDVDVIYAPIERSMSPWKDFLALLAMMKLLRRYNVDLIQSISPKAGLIAMLAGFLMRTPFRVHFFTGQVWATKKGIAKWLLKNIDRVIASCSTSALVDSHSQKAFLVKECVLSNAKSTVLASGSVSGVNAAKFKFNADSRRHIRQQFGISDSETAFLFLGRFKRDKGLLDLAESFDQLTHHHNDVHLILVGPDEDQLKVQIIALCEQSSNRLHFVDYTDKPYDYMSAADIFCLPSYREGFGSVIIEAAAIGIPSIGSRIYGISDAIVDGVTGLLHTAGDVDDIVDKMQSLIENKALRETFGHAANQRALDNFSEQKLTNALLDYYQIQIGFIK